MRNKVLTAAIIVCAFAATACNTVRGAGRDVKSAGTAVEKSAN